MATPRRTPWRTLCPKLGSFPGRAIDGRPVGRPVRSRRRRPWRRAGGIGLLSTTPHAGGLIFLGALAAAFESAAPNPLSLAVPPTVDPPAALPATLLCLGAAPPPGPVVSP